MLTRSTAKLFSAHINNKRNTVEYAKHYSNPITIRL